MEELHLYQRIAESIKQQILLGTLKPGDRLPSMRQMTTQWECTIGTVQRAYQELARQGLVSMRPGLGTRVAEQPRTQDLPPIRRATLVNRAETFLLEMLTTGYQPSEIEDAVRQALERWRTIPAQIESSTMDTLRFSGSHDLAIAWLATHFSEIAPGYNLQLSFSGSLGGLIALAQGKADLAGCHLWDKATDSYNIAYVRRLLPGQRTALITLAQRKLGLITPPGNPRKLSHLQDLLQSELRLVNRQAGSGTRVWLDASLHQLGIEPQAIKGHQSECMTHSEVAQAVAEGKADVGIGLEGAARIYGLGFVELTLERYDLIIPEHKINMPPCRFLCDWLTGDQAKRVIEQLGGYQTQATGQVEWIT